MYVWPIYLSPRSACLTSWLSSSPPGKCLCSDRVGSTPTWFLPISSQIRHLADQWEARNSSAQATGWRGAAVRTALNLLVSWYIVAVCAVPRSCSIIFTNQIKMENIGTGAQSQLHPYNCDISLLAAQGGAGGLHGHRHHQPALPAHGPHGTHLAHQDREKSFSVTHLLELPGQGGGGHLYHPPLHESLVPDHHRVHQQLKLPEGTDDIIVISIIF